MNESAPSGIRLICLTPTKNESWIIKPFAAAAKHWATDLIVADQLSTDGTREELARSPGVQLVLNDSPVFDESHRQRLLLHHARRIPGKRILIGLDADEALSANFHTSAEWEKLQNAEPGTVIRFRWVNILPGFEKAWICPGHVPLGFVDDGVEHQGRKIHSPRVPQPEGAPVLDLNDIVVLHFQYVVWERMRRKQLWYQAWEHDQNREKGPLDIFRQYNHMHGGWKPEELVPVRQEWIEEYDKLGIDFRSLICEPITWWEREVIEMMRQKGPSHFRRIALWSHNWNEVARHIGLGGVDFSDPRSLFEKVAHRLLVLTQKRRSNLPVRTFERLLRASGW